MRKKPARLQLSRKKGFNVQTASLAANGLPAANCARPSEWGNDAAKRAGVLKGPKAVALFEQWIEHVASEDYKERAAAELHGKNLACYCRLCPTHQRAGKPLGVVCAACALCHVDALLELANR